MDGKIKGVFIMMHGKNQSIKPGESKYDQFTATGDGKTNISGTKVKNIQELPDIKGDVTDATLYLFSCHSMDDEPKAHGEGDHRQGDLKGTKKTIGRVMAETFPFKSVVGTPGSVNYYNLKRGILPFERKYMTPYTTGNYWVKYTNFYKGD